MKGRVSIPVAELEYDEGGHTLWIHNAQGATVLRLKLLEGKFRSQRGCLNICAHVDIAVPGAEDVTVCLSERGEHA